MFKALFEIRRQSDEEKMPCQSVANQQPWLSFSFFWKKNTQEAKLKKKKKLSFLLCCFVIQSKNTHTKSKMKHTNNKREYWNEEDRNQIKKGEKNSTIITVTSTNWLKMLLLFFYIYINVVCLFLLKLSFFSSVCFLKQIFCTLSRLNGCWGGITPQIIIKIINQWNEMKRQKRKMVGNREEKESETHFSGRKGKVYF